MDYPIKTKVVSVKDIFSPKNSYVIPEYQRPYSWEEWNIADFVKSISDGFAENKPVFFGTVQYSVESEDSDVYEVVDGQQRMTTLILFMKLLELKTGEGYLDRYNMRLSFENSKAAGEDLEYCMGLGDEDIVIIPNSKKAKKQFYEDNDNRYYKNLCCLKTMLESTEGLSDYRAVAEYILEKLYFVRLVTEGMELPTVIGIFNTINTTGMELNSSDRFKLLYYNYLRRTDKDREWMADINACYNRVSAYEGERILMDWVLSVYKTVICIELGLGLSEYDKATDTFFEGIFNITENKDILSFDSFSFLVGVYIEMHRALSEQSLEEASVQESLCVKINEMTRYSQFWTIPYAEAFFRCRENKSIDSSELELSLKNTEALNRFFIVESVIYDKRVSGARSFICTRIFPLIKEIAEGVDVSDVVREYVTETYTDRDRNDFVKRLSENLFDNPRRCSIICIYSEMLKQIEAGKSAKQIRDSLFCGSPYDKEHIYARNLFSSYSEEDVKLYNSIGNLLLLERSINESIKDIPVSEKVKRYKESRFVSVTGISADFGSRESVQKRLDEELKLICDDIF